MNNCIKFFSTLFTSLSILTGSVILSLSSLAQAVSAFSETMTAFSKNVDFHLVSPILMHGCIQSVLFLIFMSLSLVMYLVFDSIYTHYALKFMFIEYKEERADLTSIIKRGLNWNFHRFKLIILPPYRVIFTGIALLLLSLLFFNILTFFAGFSILLTSFIFVFTITGLGLFFLLSFIISIWNFISTSFGFECAVLEPHLSNFEVERRTEKLFINSKAGFLFALISIVCIMTFIYQIYLTLIIPDIIGINNLQNLVTVLLTDIFILAILRYISLKAYFNGLLGYFERITIYRDEFYLQRKNNISLSH